MAENPYYIGYDYREVEAVRVAEKSARMYSSKPLTIGYLDHRDLRRRQIFSRPWRIAEDGTMWDEQDGKPFSTEFSHSRFATAMVAKADGHHGFALFTDADVLWLDDPQKLFALADPTKTVQVIPHNYQPATTIKMDGQVQSKYHRKLWSAVMLFNLSSKKLPTWEAVNNADGSFLHGFEWLKDEDIGFLPESFHWLPGESPTTPIGIAAEQANRPLPIDLVHMTLGIPGMPDRKATGFDTIWNGVLKESNKDFSNV